jgi:MFS family permease
MHAHKITIGMFLIVTHFGILLAVLGFWISGGFLFDEMVTALGLIGPLFAGYTTVIFSYITDQKRGAPPDEPVSIPYRAASFLVAFLFALVVGGSVVLWAYKKAFTEFEQFKVLVGMLEGAFGVYVGQFIYSMFPPAANKKTGSEQPVSTPAS